MYQRDRALRISALPDYLCDLLPHQKEERVGECCATVGEAESSLDIAGVCEAGRLTRLQVGEKEDSESVCLTVAEQSVT